MSTDIYLMPCFISEFLSTCSPSRLRTGYWRSGRTPRWRTPQRRSRRWPRRRPSRRYRRRNMLMLHHSDKLQLLPLDFHIQNCHWGRYLSDKNNLITYLHTYNISFVLRRNLFGQEYEGDKTYQDTLSVFAPPSFFAWCLLFCCCLLK